MDRLSAMEVFVQVAERNSQTAAAQALGISRTMATRYLAELENWANARLLHRTTRRMSLTPAGEQTLAQCREILALAARMVFDDDPVADVPRGLLRIACSQSLAQTVLAPALAVYLDRYPQASVELKIGPSAVCLVDERIDLAIRITNNLDPHLIARRLGACESVVCAAPSYLQAKGTPASLHDLAHHNCLIYAGKNLWAFAENGVERSISVQGNLGANDSQVLLAATIAGGGIAMQPAYETAQGIAEGSLVRVLPQLVPLPMGVYGVYSSRRHMPTLLRSVLDFLAECFSNPRHWPGAEALSRCCATAQLAPELRAG